MCWIVLFWNSGTPALMDPDEAHYAQLTREMLRARNWMVPLLDGLPYIDKPVLFHWLQGIAIVLLGETELAMRLPSAIAALALLLLTDWTGVQLLGSKTGARAALMLATVPMTFLLGSIGVFDMVFTTFLFGSIGLAMVAAIRDRPRLQWIAYVLLSLATMTKGPVALVLAGLFFFAGLLASSECRRALLSLRWKTGAVVSVALSLPWFVWMYIELGWQFVHQYALAGNLYYITQPQSFSSRAFNHTLYLSTFLAGFFPWSIVAAGGALDTIRRWRSDAKVTAEEILLWTWVVVVFVFFSLARFKVDRYVYPAAPACCLLAARAWMSVSISRADFAMARDNRFVRWAIAIVGVILLALGAFGGFALFNLGLEVPPAAIVIPLSLVAAGGVLTAWIYRQRSVSPVLFATTLTMLLVTYGSAAVIGFPLLERTRPTAAVAEDLRGALDHDDQVALFGLEKWRFSLRYYLERPVGRLRSPGDVREFLERRRGYVLMLDEDAARLRGEGVRMRAVDQRPAVTGTEGKGIRKQKWGALVVVTSDDTPRLTERVK